jgi:hypothetical protein
MKTLFGVVLLWPITLLAPSPFDGTWVPHRFEAFVEVVSRRV